MSLKVLYVEDTDSDVDALQTALSATNKDAKEWSKIQLLVVSHPSQLPQFLSQYPDVVLADVYFLREGAVPPAKPADYLDDIIRYVREWDQKSPHGFLTPVIAYTGTGSDTLKSCLKRRDRLYDIWDKMGGGVEYVAWRFQRLAAELPRYRPDATIQRLIAVMPSTDRPELHCEVLNLIKNYGQGLTEAEQIRKCRDPLQKIVDITFAEHAKALMALWDAFVQSEPLLRAASSKLRGIARHSINVFWLGYWLINNPALRKQMKTLWKGMLDRRSESYVLRDVDPLSGLNAIWVLASFFHDAGKFHEKAKALTETAATYFKEFQSLSLGTPSWTSGSSSALVGSLKDVMLTLKRQDDDPFASQIEAHIEETRSAEMPDHGAVAAAHLIRICEDPSTPRLSAYAREASRAVLLHSCLPAAFDERPKDMRASSPHLEWERDPIACLLLFCDQIQTWDRHDSEKERQDYPDRAELSFLELTSGKEGLCLSGCINYIAPSRVDLYPEHRKEIKESLNQVILEKPKDTLLHVIEANRWPFSVRLDCALNGEPLSINLSFS